MTVARSTDGATCAMTTLHLGHCRRAPRYAFTLRGETVAQYCRQHANGAGVARMLLPRPWEFDCIVDLRSGMTIHPGGIR